jgi:hypothetical protein
MNGVASSVEKDSGSRFLARIAASGEALVLDTKTDVQTLLSDGKINPLEPGFHVRMWEQAHGKSLMDFPADSEDEIRERAALYVKQMETANRVAYFLDETLSAGLRGTAGRLSEEGLQDERVFDWLAGKFENTPAILASAAERSLPYASAWEFVKLESILRLIVKNRTLSV